MSKEITKRVEKVFSGGSRGEENSSRNEFLIALVVLGIFALVLILIIIYGYFKYVRGRGDGRGERRERIEKEGEEEAMEGGEGSVPKEATEDAEQPPPETVSSTLSVPVKLRKRSMTFSETDEECRKYREDLADSYTKPETLENPERSRKKSVVTFVGVKEIDS